MSFLNSKLKTQNSKLAAAAVLAALALACPRPVRHAPEPPLPAPAAEKAPSARALPEGKGTVGAQIFRLPEPERLDAFLDRLQAAGVNTIYVRAFHNPVDRFHGGSPANAPKAGVYFETPRAPLVADLMPDIIRRGHAREMRVFAWMTSREITWDFPDKAELLEYQYDFSVQQITRGKGLDIFHPAAESYLAALYRDLARAGADGVLFQDDLVLRHGVGFGPHAEEAFARRTSLPLRPNLLYAKVEWTPAGRPRATYTDLFWEWSKMKSERILALVLRLREAAREINPHVEIAMNVYYDSVLMPRNGLAWLSQDVEAWAASPVESFAVMAYHRQMADELSLSHKETLSRLKDMRRAMEAWTKHDRRRVLWKVQTRDWTTREFVPNDEIASAISALGAGGNLVLVPVEEDWDGLDGWRFGTE